MKYNIWYSLGDSEVCQSWALSIGSLIVRLLGSQKLTHNQRLPSFLGRNKIGFSTCDLEGRIIPLARSWYKSLEFIAPPVLSYIDRTVECLLTLYQVDSLIIDVGELWYFHLQIGPDASTVSILKRLCNLASFLIWIQHCPIADSFNSQSAHWA